MSEDYPTLASVDLAVWRAFERLIKYRAADDANSVVIQEAVVNRLLARRSVLMAVRDGRPTP